MKKTLSLVFSFFLLCHSFSQDTARKSYVRRPAYGISFLFNDYITPQRIRASSLSSVLANKQKAKFNEMETGIAITYFKGLTNHLDLAPQLPVPLLIMLLVVRMQLKVNCYWKEMFRLT